MSFIQIRIVNASQDIKDILVALLSESHYEGFEEEKEDLKAFIPASLFNKETLRQLADQFGVQYSVSELPDTNWNSVWESNFHPVIVDRFCAIRADFHEPVTHVSHDIIITPKMSFGTGHHPSTLMMIRQMEHIDFVNKRVLDFGTGTGVLAILAEKLGAAGVQAIDNDDWSIANAEENFRKNNTVVAELKKADTASAEGPFDIILANITRNVILENFSLFVSHLSEKGILLLSGLLHDDEKEILKKASQYGLGFEKKLNQDNWICLKFSRH